MSLIIPVILCSDQKYVPYLCVTIRSIIDHANETDEYRLYILSDGIDAIGRNRILLCNDKSNVFVSFVETEEITRNRTFHIPKQTNWSRVSFFRLFLSEMFPQYDKVIFLDCDIIFRRDLSDLFALATFEHRELIAAVEDVYCEYYAVYVSGRYFKNAVGIEGEKGERCFYFNAGVQVINCARFRTEQIQEKLLPELDREYLFVDQDILNKHCKGRIQWLDYRWNCMSDLEDESIKHEYRNVIEQSMDDPWIIHYAPAKPWNYRSTAGKKCLLSAEWWKVARETPYYEQLLYEYHKMPLHAEFSSWVIDNGRRIFLERSRKAFGKIITVKPIRKIAIKLYQKVYR